MIGLPPGMPVNPLTLARESQKPHAPTLMERVLKIEVTFRTATGVQKVTREQKG